MKNTLILSFTIPLLVIAQGCTKKESMPETSVKPANLSNVITPPGTGSELKKEDLMVGNGAEAIAGKTVSVHYTGWLTDGKKFDSSKDRGQPFEFKIGSGQVIQGWDQGIAGMKVGGKRKLIIPPQLGYGDHGAGGVIPPQSTLIFEVELLAVQ